MAARPCHHRGEMYVAHARATVDHLVIIMTLFERRRNCLQTVDQLKATFICGKNELLRTTTGGALGGEASPTRSGCAKLGLGLRACWPRALLRRFVLRASPDAAHIVFPPDALGGRWVAGVSRPSTDGDIRQGIRGIAGAGQEGAGAGQEGIAVSFCHSVSPVQMFARPSRLRVSRYPSLYWGLPPTITTPTQVIISSCPLPASAEHAGEFDSREQHFLSHIRTPGTACGHSTLTFLFYCRDRNS